MRHSRELSRLGTPLAIGLVGFFGISALKGCNEAPVNITAGATVDDIRPSDAVPLIDVGGEASGVANTFDRFPIINSKIPFSDAKASTTINGIVEVRTDQSGVAFSTYRLKPKLPIPKSKSPSNNIDNVGIKATVDTSHIYMRPSFSTLYREGVAQQDIKTGPLSFLTQKGVLNLHALADSGARIHYIYSCGNATLPTLAAGVQNYTRKVVANTAAIPAKLEGGKQEADQMRTLAKRPIKVVFTQPAVLPGDHVIQQPLDDPRMIKLRYQNTSLVGSPIEPIPDEKSALDSLLQGPHGKNLNKDTEVNGGKPCTFTGKSALQLYNLSGKPAAKQPAT